MTHTTWVEVDGAAIRHNLIEIQSRVAPAAVMAIVKGNAYGHGLREVAGALRGVAQWFGVNALHEAQTLRDEGHSTPILILGNMHPEQAHAVVSGDFHQAIYDIESLDALGAAAARDGRRARVHLKIETGTYRQGVQGEELVALADAVRHHQSVDLEGLYTHYANIEEAGDFGYAEHQLERFDDAVRTVEKTASSWSRH